MSSGKNQLGEDVVWIKRVDRSDFFSVTMCGVTRPNPDYEMFRSGNPVYVFEYVISGKGFIDSGGQRYSVGAGDFYLLRKGFTGHYFADRGDPYEKIWANVNGELVDSAVKLYGADEPVVICRDADRRVMRDLSAIFRVMSDCGDMVEAQRVASMKLIDILSLIKNSEKWNESVAVRSTAEQIKNYLDTHIYDDITLTDIADSLFMHETTVIRVFRRAYGTTPKRYLSELRLKAACRMIDDKIPIKHVASSLRFSETAYFSLAFRKEFGMSPTEYRENHR